MTEYSKTHDFNWVDALHKCSFSNPGAVATLRDHVRSSVSSQQSIEWSSEILEVDTIEFHEDPTDPNRFTVTRKKPRHPVVEAVKPSGYDDIVIFDAKGPYLHIEHKQRGHEEPRRSYRVTATLNRSQQCRYEIDGSGTYELWEVVKLALERIFLPDTVG